MTSGDSGAIMAGDLLSLAEDEYMYGRGALRLRVAQVLHSQIIDGYIGVIGYPIEWNGDRGRDRIAYISKAALPDIRARSNVD